MARRRGASPRPLPTVDASMAYSIVGEGDSAASLLLVADFGFESEAGQLLEKMILAIRLTRKEIYFARIDQNIEAGVGLGATLSKVHPQVVVAFGELATQLLLPDASFSTVRGQFQDLAGIRVMPTYSPVHLLRFPNQKRDAWNDLQAVAQVLGLGLPPRASKN